MAKITVIAAHPAPDNSLANKTILEQFHQLVSEAEIVHIAKTYPDWRFDVKKEQERLLASETIVFEFPVWWYAIPWLLEKYLTDVFAYGYAYGTKFALEGKRFILSFTCGGGEKSYTKDGLYHCTIDQIMLPMYATASYCRLNYIGNIISYHMIPDDDPVDGIIDKAKKHADRLAIMVGK